MFCLHHGLLLTVRWLDCSVVVFYGLEEQLSSLFASNFGISSIFRSMNLKALHFLVPLSYYREPFFYPPHSVLIEGLAQVNLTNFTAEEVTVGGATLFGLYILCLVRRIYVRVATIFDKSLTFIHIFLLVVRMQLCWFRKCDWDQLLEITIRNTYGCRRMYKQMLWTTYNWFMKKSFFSPFVLFRARWRFWLYGWILTDLPDIRDEERLLPTRTEQF